MSKIINYVIGGLATVVFSYQIWTCPLLRKTHESESDKLKYRPERTTLTNQTLNNIDQEIPEKQSIIEKKAEYFTLENKNDL